jgi:regulator of replication initiation timing
MTEHRAILDPAILGRLATSMEQFEGAWLNDLAELRRLEGKLADTERLLNAATDRSSDLQADLRATREENKALILDNAHLKAQLQSLYDNSQDAKLALDNLSLRAVDAARSIPSQEWKDPEKKPRGDDDGTDLPRGQPMFMTSQSAEQSEESRTLIPVNEYGRRAGVGAHS